MQLPKELRKLYKHWEYHTSLPTGKNLATVEGKVLNEITTFITERQVIWQKKVTNQPKPWTDNIILRDFRFCNIYRELDKETIEIHKQLLPLRDDFPLWLLNVAFQRFVCNSETVAKAGLLSFDTENNKQVYEKLVDLPSPKYGTAYIFPISTIMKSPYPTRESFFCFYLPSVIQKCTEVIKKADRHGVAELLEKVLPVFGFNLKFHWTEILIDVAYQFPKYIDLFKRFPIGPGSAPTMKRLNSTLSGEETCHFLTTLQPSSFPFLEIDGKKVYLSTENWEGIGCEFRKYSNLQSGAGRRRLYL